MISVLIIYRGTNMNKNMLVSRVLVFFFTLTFLAGGLYVFDMVARSNNSTAIKVYELPSKDHAILKKINRIREVDTTVFFNLKRS
jgi:hypothetical protein